MGRRGSLRPARARRDAGPRPHDLGDVVRGDLLLEQRAGALERGDGRLLLGHPVRQLAGASVLELRRRAVVRLALGLLDADGQLLDLALGLAHRRDGRLLGLPALLQGAGLLGQLGELLLQDLESRPRGIVGLLAEGLALDLQLDPAPLQLVQLDRHGVDLHPQAARGLVDEVDRLVGQEALGDVAVGQRGGGDQRGVRDPDAVVDLVALAEAAQDRDRLLDRWLVHHDRLEAPLERRVLLDVLAVLVERGRADRVELASRQHRLEQVGRVHRALGGARAHHGVELVDEQDHAAFAVLDLLEDRLETLLELAAELGPGDDRAEVERDDALVLERLGDVASDDPLREPLGNGGLADARLADQHRVVLGAAAEDLDDAPDLLVPADDGVEPACARLGREVAAVLLERLVGRLGVGARHALAAAHALERAEDRLAACAVLLEQPLRVATHLGHADQEVLGAGVLVAHPPRLVLGAVDDALRARVQAQLAALDAGAPRQDRGDLAPERGEIHAQAPERLGGDAVVRTDERREQVLRVQDGALHPLGELLGGDDGLLGLLGESVELHLVRALVSGVRVSLEASAGDARIGLVDQVQERLGRVPRRVAHRGRQDDPHLHVQVPGAAVLDRGHALAFQAEGPAALGPGGDGEEDPALEGGHRHLRPQQRLAQRDRELALEVRPTALVDVVGPHADGHDDVAPAGTLAAEPDAAPRVHAAG